MIMITVIMMMIVAMIMIKIVNVGSIEYIWGLWVIDCNCWYDTENNKIEKYKNSLTRI